MAEVQIYVYETLYSEDWGDQQIMGKRKGTLDLKSMVRFLTGDLIAWAAKTGEDYTLIIEVKDEALMGNGVTTKYDHVGYRVIAATEAIATIVSQAISREVWNKKYGYYP